ncbi:MAG: AAA-like domain-containing protein [Nostoc sp. NMS7]|uniref:AAA-like domain-containing protein n=1 Tax=Nostoc sp. NMS7 TaxID=2815391 RepID=UPI0025DC86E5|nr:AAA-like domain-containing protein [Nostoc sp. NMS7]MBN3945141.1 AAA-like domain-containing protein [Nostoc sp. NMS7]
MKKILILSANPINTSKLRLDEEVREIQAGLERARSRDKFEIITKWAVRTDDLRRALLDHEPEIVHFSGHGLRKDGLCLENSAGTIQAVSTNSLARLFGLFEKTECVLLNACYSEAQAEAIFQRVDRVIGMNQVIGDRAAIKFAVGFYDALGANRSYEDAYEFGCSAIALEGIPESATPVLKSRDITYVTISPQENGSVNHFIPLLENPEGSVPLNSPFYINNPTIESDYHSQILQPGALIRIKAPQQWGKTSLMVRILDAAQQQGYQTICINLFNTEKDLFTNLDKFLQWFCLNIADELNIEDNLVDYWQDSRSPKINCTNYFQRYLLQNFNNSLVLALDNVDLIFQYPEIANEFFGLLRTWYEASRTKPIWEKIRLVISHSHRVDTSLNQSSLSNVGLIIELKDFTQKQINDLVQRHGINWTEKEIESLIEMIGGHPYLLRLGLRKIAHKELTLQKLLEKASTDEGLYGNHLRNHLSNLKKNPKLSTAMKDVVNANNPISIDDEIAAQLRSMGLVKYAVNNVVPVCDMYRFYFREHLV